MRTEFFKSQKFQKKGFSYTCKKKFIFEFVFIPLDFFHTFGFVSYPKVGFSDPFHTKIVFGPVPHLEHIFFQFGIKLGSAFSGSVSESSLFYVFRIRVFFIFFLFIADLL
jgi:hypothetical protein